MLPSEDLTSISYTLSAGQRQMMVSGPLKVIKGVPYLILRTDGKETQLEIDPEHIELSPKGLGAPYRYLRPIVLQEGP